MLLRNMQLVNAKPAAVQMPPQHKAVFEEGVALSFGRWTALQLGVANEWGGPSSREKAQALLEDVIGWFYSTKGTGRGAKGEGAAAAAGLGKQQVPAGSAPRRLRRLQGSAANTFA